MLNSSNWPAPAITRERIMHKALTREARAGSSCIVYIEIKAWSRIVNLPINLISRSTNQIWSEQPFLRSNNDTTEKLRNIQNQERKNQKCLQQYMHICMNCNIFYTMKLSEVMWVLTKMIGFEFFFQTQTDWKKPRQTIYIYIARRMIFFNKYSKGNMVHLNS